MATEIHIENVSGQPDLPDFDTMRQWIMRVLNHQNIDNAELAIQIIDDEEMAALNHQYRHKNKPTNVLSFPADIPESLGIPLLGDIAVCAQVVAMAASEQSKSVPAHWAHMLVHGTLHLLGYDHIDEGDAEEMEAIETTLITDMGFPPPYKEQPEMCEGKNL